MVGMTQHREEIRPDRRDERVASRYHCGMNLVAELEHVIADPAVASAVTQLMEKLLTEARTEVERQAAEQLARRDVELHAAKTKIDALVLELAHLRRMRFGARSEALGAETRDLFQEAIEADIAAAKLELEQRQAEAGETKPPKQPRERAGRQPLPEHLPRIEHRHEPESCTCGQCGKDLVLIVRQLDPGSGKTHRAYLWAYRSNVLDTGPPIVVFDYQSSRSGAHARNFLQDWQGALMVDDFGGYKALFTQGVTELGCLAHARRKFFDLNAAQPNAIAQEALARIAALYEIEQRGRTMSVEHRTALRQSEAAPLLESLHDWLKAMHLTVANGGGTAKAIDYSLKRWPALCRYATDGTLPIDNNPVENAIRPICPGKKNWLFTGSERAGQRAAAIQSLLATAALNGLDPAAWLRDTLEKLPTCLNRNIDSLLPLPQTT